MRSDIVFLIIGITVSLNASAAAVYSYRACVTFAAQRTPEQERIQESPGAPLDTSGWFGVLMVFLAIVAISSLAWTLASSWQVFVDVCSPSRPSGQYQPVATAGSK